VTSYVHSCLVCQSVKHSQKKPAGLLRPLPIPTRPYDTITMGFVGPLPESGERKYDYILVVVDKFSKRVSFIPCHKAINAVQTARLLLDHVVRYWGLPSSIISDRDPRWTGTMWTELFTAMGTKLRRSSAYHPQTDGQTERANRSLEAGLRAYVNSKGNDWSTWLSMVEMSINSSEHEATKKTPFEMTGVDWKDPVSLAMQLAAGGEMKSDSASEIRAGIKTAWEDARAMLMQSQVRMKKYADMRRRDEQYAVGDQVMLSTKHMAKQQGKLNPLFVGPFEVVRVGERGSVVELNLPPIYQKLHQPFNVDRVKRYTPSEVEWVGREQKDRPLPEMIDGEREWEVEAIIGKKSETRMEVVYDPKAVEEETAAREAEMKAAVEEVLERKEAEGVSGWGSRLRPRHPLVTNPSSAVKVKTKKGRKVKEKRVEVTRTLYLVRWKGYAEETWESEDNLVNSRDMIEEYERKQAVDREAASDTSVALQYLYAWTEVEPGKAVLSCALVL
jgi:hypothetical protein